MSSKDTSMHQLRCKKCNKLLAVNGLDSSIEIKCGRCGCLNILFEEMSEQVIITDSEGIILFANGALHKTTGFTIEEVVGKTPSLWGGQMSKDFYKEMWNEIKHKKKSIEVMVKNKTKDNKIYNAKLQISPVLDTQGSVRFFVGIETIEKDL